MIISGSSRTNRTEFLIRKYIELVKRGISTAEILVLVQNRHKKQYFIEKIKDSLNVLENPKIYTFFGLVYNTIKTDWADVFRGFGAVLRNRQYLCYILQFGFAQGMLFANISSAPFT